MKKVFLLGSASRKSDSPDDLVTRRIALVVLSLALAASLSLIVLGINRNLMLILGVVIALSWMLARRGVLTPAIVLLPGISLVFFGYLMFTNEGIRDTAFIGLPIVIVAASLISRRGIGAIVFGILSLGVLFLLWYAEAQGVTPGTAMYANAPSDYLAAAIGIVILTSMQWILVNLLNENIREARLELTERHKAETILHQREAILSIVARAAERLLETSDWRRYAPELLKQLGEATLASHTYIFENSTVGESARSTSQLYEWDVREARLVVANPHYQNVLIQEDGLDDWFESIRRGKVYYSSTRDFPPQWQLANPDIKTLLDVPIFTGNQLWGVIGFDDCEREMAWSQAEIDALLTAAKMLGAAIQRQSDEQALRASKKELLAKNAELERFTYTVSHDLKAPLITIRGFLGYLEEDLRRGDAERLKTDSRRIVEATDKMSRLLNELLELSRIGRIVNPPELAPFEEIVREAVGAVEGRLAGRNIQVQIAPGLPVVRGDRVRLAEAVQNLIDNAAKFMGDQPHPKIEIGARVDVDPIVFFVRDNGMGIQPEYAQRIFGLFDKIDPRSEGTGVGLAIVKRIIEVHGGEIWVDSTPGAGAAFYFTLHAEKE